MNLQSYIVLAVVLALAAWVAWFRFGPHEKQRLPSCCGCDGQCCK